MNTPKIRVRCGNISAELAEGWSKFYLIQFTHDGEPVSMIGVNRKNCRRFSPAFALLRDALTSGRILNKTVIVGCKTHGCCWRDGILSLWRRHETGTLTRVEIAARTCLSDTAERRAGLLKLLEIIINSNQEVA